MDHAERFALKKADELEKAIASIYAQAAREIRGKLQAFIAGFKARDQVMQQQLADGTITKKQYQSWLQGQVFQGRQWRRKLEDVTNVYVNADKKAREIIGKTNRTVFAEAANYTAYDIERHTGISAVFDLYDEATVDRLIADNPKMLPEWKIDEPKDYIWNEKRVQNAVTQGIIQGESISDIGNRLYRDLSASNAGKMDMFARTAVTGAQNAGRVERMREAEDMDIEVKKKWVATPDDRTRDTHADLDGDERDPDEPFEVDGMEIMYPGDPNAPPELVYNCRCTLTYTYPKYRHLQKTERYESYTRWQESRRR